MIVPSIFFYDKKIVVTLAGAPPRGLASKDEFVAAAGRFSPEDTVLQWRCTGGVRWTEEQCPVEPCWCIMMHGIHTYIQRVYIYIYCIMYTVYIYIFKAINNNNNGGNNKIIYYCLGFIVIVNMFTTIIIWCIRIWLWPNAGRSGIYGCASQIWSPVFTRQRVWAIW